MPTNTAMKFLPPMLASVVLLAGCGLAETAATGAAGAAAEAEAAKNAKQQGDIAVEKIKAAEQAAAAQREQADRQD
jgi:xanthine/uracil permease